jgi:hypothetical protein
MLLLWEDLLGSSRMPFGIAQHRLSMQLAGQVSPPMHGGPESTWDRQVCDLLLRADPQARLWLLGIFLLVMGMR